MKKELKINNLKIGNLYFSDCREITGDELYKINGGKQVENSNEGVANAQPGDTIIRDDHTEITLNQGDIDWAQAHTGSGNTTTQTIQNPVDTNHSTNPINPTGTPTGATTSVSINSFTPVPTGNYEIDNVNQIVSVDINNPQNIIHTFKNDKEVKNYVKSFDKSNNILNFVKLLMNDNSPKIYTVGLTGSVTYTVGSEAVGLGIGLSASAGINFGEYINLDSMQGKYIESGLSIGKYGVSLGIDAVNNSEYQYIEKTTSIGVGAGYLLEGHTRVGITKLFSITEGGKW